MPIKYICIGCGKEVVTYPSKNRGGYCSWGCYLSKYTSVLTKDFLVKEYIENLKSLHDISKETEISVSAIKNAMIKYSIPRREKGYATALSRLKGRTFNITSVKNYIDGLLLSDGGLYSKSFSGYYTQGCIYEEWLMSIQNYFFHNGIENTIRYDNKRGIYILTTLYYPEFKQIRKRWYPNGKKIVPRDLCLTPETIANWYLGDGCLHKKWKYIKLTCEGFGYDGVRWLSKKLNKTLNVDSRVWKSNNISIPKKNVPIFLRYIKNYLIPCYAYKFEGVNLEV